MKSILVFMVVLLLASSVGCSHYSRGPWMGKVIDSETKSPIEGAAVVAVWKEDYAVPPGGGTSFVDAEETLTDNEGYFEISSKSFLAMRPKGQIHGPYFTFYKPSYKVYQYGESGFNKSSTEWHVYPDDWKGRFEKPDAVVELIKLRTREERLKNLPGKSTPGVDSLHYNKIESFIRLMNEESVDLGLKPY